MLLLLLSLQLLSTVSSFLIIDAEPGLVVVEPGQMVKLSCITDSDYEYCLWHSPAKKTCDFEWKRSEDNITMQECPLNENHQKISFHGKYDDRQCGISFRATEEDTGIWKCEVEEYVWGGSRNSGRKVFATMKVTVQASTTRAPTPPSTTATTTTTSPPPRPLLFSSTTSTVPTSSQTTSVASSKTSQAPTGSGDGRSDSPEAVPRVDSDSSGVSSAGGGATAGVVITVLLLLGAVIAGAVFYQRRRQRKRPDAEAAVVYDREAKASRDTTNMMRNNPELTIKEGSSPDLENKNLHEFFPHSESFA